MFGPPKGGAVLDEFESGFSRFNNVHSDILTTYECRGLHSCAVCYPSCLKSPPHHLTSCLIHTDWTQSLLLRRTARPRMFQTTGGIVDMPLELAGTLRLFHENLPVCCVLAFVCDSLFWCECTKRRWHCFGTARLDVASERAQQLFTLFYLCYLLSDRWHINTPLSVLGLREEPAVLILCSKSPTVQDFTDV